jgi:hypothetical protein
MKRSEQIKLVKDVTKNLCLSIVVDINLGKIPKEWDGIELRALIARKALEATCPMLPKRIKEFNNTVLVNNL